MKIRIINIVVGLLVLYAPLSQAEMEVSGYASFSGTITSAKDITDTEVVYYNGLANKNANFNNEDNLIGLQFTADVSEKIDMTLVLQANGGTSNYDVEAQWGYATYKFNDELSLRIGKYKGSFYMVSDYKDVGYAYPWVRPPLEVYSTNPIEALNGLDLVYQTNLGEMTFLTELYIGSGTHTATMLPGTIDGWVGYGFGAAGSEPPKGTGVSFETPNSTGLNVSLSGDIGTVRLGYYSTDVNAASFGVSDEKGTFLGFGFNIDWNNLVVYSEYVQRDTSEGALAFAFPDQEAYYVTLGYRMGNYLPYVTVANLAEGKDFSPVAQEQSSVAVGLRYEVSDTSALKFEVLNVTTKDSSYGLFDSPTKDGTVATVKFDVIY